MGVFEEFAAKQAGTAGPAAAGYSVMRKALSLGVFLWIAAASVSLAQTAPGTAGPPAPRQWQSLSPDQQHLLQKYQDSWNNLPPERQQALARGSQRWLSMTPEQRSSAEQRFSEWRAMPPEQRQVLRQRWQEFKSLPPGEQQRIRESYQRFRQMPAERRSELRRQWHQMTPEQRRSFQHGTHAARPHGH
jgi:hypothetical protein